MHPALFNEEVCEAQLSSLARYVANDFTKHDGVALNRQFLMTSRVRGLLSKDREQYDRGVARAARWRHTLDEDCPDLIETTSFFRGLVRKLAAGNQFMVYTGDPKQWKNSKFASATCQSLDTPLWDVPDTGSYVQTMIARAKNESVRPWLDVAQWNEVKGAAVEVKALNDMTEVEIEDMLRAAVRDRVDDEVRPDDQSDEEGEADPDEQIVAPQPPRAGSAVERKARARPVQRPRAQRAEPEEQEEIESDEDRPMVRRARTSVEQKRPREMKVCLCHVSSHLHTGSSKSCWNWC